MKRIPVSIYLLALLANVLVSELIPNTVSSLFATGVFIAFIFTMFRTYVVPTALILPLIIPHFAALVSLNFIDMGSYMPELGITGAPSSSASSYAFYNILMYYIAILFINWKVKNKQILFHRFSSSSEISCLFGCVFGAFAFLYLIFAGISTGFPLLSGTDRFAFRMDSADIIVLNILNLKFVIAVSLGLPFAASRNKYIRYSSLLILLLIVPAFFLYGDKFFTILCFICFFISPLFVIKPQLASKYAARIAPVFSVGIVCMFAVTLFVYSDYGNGSLSEAGIKLGNRIAGQGQLWYIYVVERGAIFSFRTDIIFENLASIFARNQIDYNFNNRLATFYFADEFAPFTLLDSMNRNLGSTTFTIGLEAYGAIIFGYFGLVFFMAAIGVLIGFFAVFYFNALRSGDAVAALAPTFIMVSLWFMINQGTINSLFALGPLKSILAFVVLNISFKIFMRMLAVKPNIGGRLSTRR